MMERRRTRDMAIGALLMVAAGLARPLGVVPVLPLLIAATAFWVDAALAPQFAPRSLVWRMAFAAFGIRWTLAILLYCASYFQWPIARGLQAGNGFWTFCMDAVNYHRGSLGVMDAVTWGLPLPSTGAGIDYYLVVAFVYSLFGTSPLTAICFNILAWTLAGVMLVRLFTLLRGARLPGPVVAAIMFWPSGLIWPTQLMKDSLVLFLIVAAAFAGVELIRSRGVSIARYSAILALALIPLLRLRIYDGRILFAAAVVAAVGGLAFSRLQAWRAFALAWVVAAVASFAVAYVGMPDPYVLLGSVNPVGAYLHYSDELRARGQVPAAIVAYNSGLELMTPRMVPRDTPTSGVADDPILGSKSESDGIVSHVLAVTADSVAAMTPERLEVMRYKYAMTQGNSALSTPEEGLHGWRDALRLAPVSIATGLLAPAPWDVLRPRGITGQFRTFAVSESLLMALLLPAIVLGLLRLRRTDELFVAAMALGGIVAASLVITNLGTLFRLRASFTIVLIGFSAYGFDIYAWAARRIRRTRPADRAR
jgi:hypothetical protein